MRKRPLFIDNRLAPELTRQVHSAGLNGALWSIAHLHQADVTGSRQVLTPGARF
jgi:hypothetical protein